MRVQEEKWGSGTSLDNTEVKDLTRYLMRYI